MARPKKIKFEFPATIRHEETKVVVSGIIRQLEEERKLTFADIPHLHRLATSYDLYLTANDELFASGAITVNKKGEEVKHPYVNIARENWNEFLRITREFGITPKSKSQMGSHKPEKTKEDDPLDLFNKGE